MADIDMSCARVKQYQSSNVSKIERHNERKNDSYDNVNVVAERIPLNVHYRYPSADSYMDVLRNMEAEGKISTRGLRQDATLFDEIIIDVNTRYFERNGGYEYAKAFYEEAYHFIEKKFGTEYVVSAVMHADEINKAVTDEKGKDVYHYHLHAVVLPVVEKKILWSKRCKDEALRGTVKEVIHQISHSKKWASTVPLMDENGQPVLRKNGKPKYRASYSVLQDELFEHMQEHGFTDFQRGELGSTSENLTSLQYQIEKDKERLTEIQTRIEEEKVKYEPIADVHKTVAEIETMGQKTITGRVSLSKEDYQDLTALAKEGITSRSEIQHMKDNLSYYQRNYFDSANALDRMKQRYTELEERCKPFIQAMEHFPELAKAFAEKIKDLLQAKTEQEKQEREARKAARKAERMKRRRSSEWER